LIALDSSVVVASFGAWHEHHGPARDVLAARPRLPAHAGLEAYAVLTRLPEPFRAEPRTVAEFLSRTFASVRLVLGADDQAGLPDRLAGLGISGGSVYDALIALTAGAADAELLTLDRRALATYERCRVQARLLT
jgi:predicted nucleic acid-binding protein